MSLPVAILAGGLATRLHPVTLTIPKSLVEVAGRPFLEHQLTLLRRQGFRQVVLCVGHYAEMIEAAVGDGTRLDMHIAYSHEEDRLLGTGGALRKAMDKLGPQFLVMYGDSYLRCDLAAVEQAFLRSGQPGLMTVYHNDGRYDKSNVLYRNGKIVQYDKQHPCAAMQYIDYGLGALCAEVLLPYATDSPFDLADVYHALAAADLLAAYEVSERFFEIGSPDGLEETRRFFLETKVTA